MIIVVVLVLSSGSGVKDQAMDLVLNYVDEKLLTPYVYPKSWPEEDVFRQILTLYVMTCAGGWLLYFITALLSYIFVFDKRYELHPHFLPNQVKLEILYASQSIPFIAVLTVPMFMLEVRGYTKLYMETETVSENISSSKQTTVFQYCMQGWPFILVSIIAFLMFTDCLIYWIHRGLHHRLVYKHLHKGHHTWKIPTPFASHAFHPLDGFLQSLPYHLYPLLFPLHKVVYLVLFVLVNVWTVSIHDGDYQVPKLLQPLINGSAHHTDHHILYKYNYGQFFTLWDRIGGTFQYPTQLSGKTLLDEIEELKKHKKL